MKKYFLTLVLIILTFNACGQVSEVSDQVISTDEFVNTVVSYSLNEVSKHSEKGDCWFAISGKVYDVSEYASHPGGVAILQGCGKDATELFETRPMGSGTAHSERARGFLENYYIGELE